MKKLVVATIFLAGLGLPALGSPAHASTMVMGAYPSSLIVFDEGKGVVTQHIPLVTGLPRMMRLSMDKKRIYVYTNDHSGIEVVDVATRKVIKSFVLNDEKTRYRFEGGVPDPSGKFFYTVLTEIDKRVDHFDIGKPQFAVIDLDQGKVVKAVDVDKQDQDSFRGRNRMEISTDGKYLYQFGRNVIVVDTGTMKVVDRIALSKADLPGFENVDFGASLDSIGEPGEFISVFNGPEAFTETPTFGVAKFNLDTRQYSFTPIGPAPTAMSGLQIAPNKKDAYVVAINGQFGNKRCEFWHFDLGTNAIRNRGEFPCRSRFTFTMSGDAKKLYIYAAGFEIEVYDAATLKYERTLELPNDTTGAGMIPIN